jgi:hypothetical protein
MPAHWDAQIAAGILAKWQHASSYLVSPTLTSLYTYTYIHTITTTAANTHHIFHSPLHHIINSSSTIGQQNAEPGADNDDESPANASPRQNYDSKAVDPKHVESTQAPPNKRKTKVCSFLC